MKTVKKKFSGPPRSLFKKRQIKAGLWSRNRTREERIARRLYDAKTKGIDYENFIYMLQHEPADLTVRDQKCSFFLMLTDEHQEQLMQRSQQAVSSLVDLLAARQAQLEQHLRAEAPTIQEMLESALFE